jgi:L-fucose isomerase-like protein
MRNALDVKVNIKPVFSSMIHADAWEGPCRVGSKKELSKEHEIEVNEKQFATWGKVLEENIDTSVANILEPVYIQFSETFVVPDSEFKKLEKDVFETDIYLITYRVPGLVERFNKPVAMINLGPTPVDLVAYYADINKEAYMAHDYEEFNEIIELLQVRKAIANTKIMILSGSEIIPVSVNSSIYDLPALEEKYGIRNNRLTYRMVFDEMEKIKEKGCKEVDKITSELLSNAEKATIKKEDLTQDIYFYRAIKNIMEEFDCNAFTIPCKDLCASRFPEKMRCVPCVAHSLLKDEKIPTACEEDLSAWLAVTFLMYLSKKSVFMGNPVLVKKGKYTIEELGIMKGLVSTPAYTFDEEMLEIHHSTPGLKMDGFDQAPLPYEVGHFTYEGWGGKVQVDMAKHDDKTVTLARFNRSADKVIVAKAEIVACEFREIYCSPAVYYRVEGGARNFRQRLAKGGYGHHLAVVYGDYREKMCKLAEIMNFEIEVFN